MASVLFRQGSASCREVNVSTVTKKSDRAAPWLQTSLLIVPLKSDSAPLKKQRAAENCVCRAAGDVAAQADASGRNAAVSRRSFSVPPAGR